MTEHFTKNTVSASFYCSKCSKHTQHRIDGGRKGPCLECLGKLERDHTEMTEAQLRICRQHLRQDVCPICGRPKERDQCFCRACYFALPEAMRAGLWIRRLDPQSLLEWSAKYTAAKDYLRRNGHDDLSGNLFEAMT